MRIGLAGLALLFASCRTEPPPPAAPSPSSPAAATAPPDAGASAASPDAADCVEDCVARSQMQARPIEQIRADCQEKCRK